MDRMIFRTLDNWRCKPRRKPLVLLGPRQVGKTYALNHLGAQKFMSTAYINFVVAPSIPDT